MQKYNKSELAQIGASFKFAKLAKDPSFKFLSFCECRKDSQEICLILGNLFFPNRNHKKSNFDFFSLKIYDGETRFSSQNCLTQAEISYESKVVLFDQMKVSARRTGLKN